MADAMSPTAGRKRTAPLQAINADPLTLASAGHKVYRAADTALIPLSAHFQRPENSSETEQRYRRLLLDIDLTKNFYFSYTYNLALTLQRNLSPACNPRSECAPTSSTGAAPNPAPSSMHPSPDAHTAAALEKDADAAGLMDSVFDSMYVWNSYLSRGLRQVVLSERWSVPLVHGFFEQRRLSLFGRQLTITLIARRSRHFAGAAALPCACLCLCLSNVCQLPVVSLMGAGFIV